VKEREEWRLQKCVFLRAIAGYRTMDHKRKEDIME
jgi:hypothetical protein